MTDEQRHLWDFITKRLPYATMYNPECDYSPEEYKAAKAILEPDLSKFKENEHKKVIEAIACLLVSIKRGLSEFEKMNDEEFKQRGENWRQYHKMIPEFNRVMQSLVYDPYKGELAGKMLFPIRRIIFEGEYPKDNEKAILEGPILEIIRAMFKAFDDVVSKQDQERLRNFSYDLYEAYTEFMMQWAVVSSEEGTLGSSVKEVREETIIDTALNKYKYTLAYNIHASLFKLSIHETSAKIPSLHKRIVGKILQEVKLFDYGGYIDDKQIENFIKRGMP